MLFGKKMPFKKYPYYLISLKKNSQRLNNNKKE
jgi:hypothetical protein